MTKLLPAFLVAFLLSVAPALAQTCPATPTACPSPTYNNLTAGGLLSANGGLVATTGAFTTLSTTGNLTVGGSFSAPSLTLTGAGTALNVTNNATIGGTLGVGGTLTLGTGGASGQRIQASGTGNMVVQLGGSASIMNFVAGTGNSLLQINSATNQVISERMLVLNALGVSNPVASGSAQTAPLYSTLAWTGSSTLNNTVLSTGFYISNSTAIAAANNVPQNVGYIANVTATGVNGNVGTFGVNLIQNAVNAMSGSPTYTAMASYVFMQANDGGTGTGTNARGQATALNLVTGFNAPGGFLNGGSGTEIDMFATTGTYIQGKVGILIALASQNTVQGDLEDAAMVFDRPLTSPGWKTIFQIGDSAWAGIDPTNGWVMQFFGHNFTGSVPGAGGIDFTNFTPSVAFIRGPGFLLDPSGNFTAASLTTTGTLSAASLTLTGAGTALNVTNNATVGGTLTVGSGSTNATIQQGGTGVLLIHKLASVNGQFRFQTSTGADMLNMGGSTFDIQPLTNFSFQGGTWGAGALTNNKPPLWMNITMTGTAVPTAFGMFAQITENTDTGINGRALFQGNLYAGAGSRGGRWGAILVTQLTAASANTSGVAYGGVQANCVIGATDTFPPSCFAANNVAHILAGITGQNIVGTEIDTVTENGSVFVDKFGLLVADLQQAGSNGGVLGSRDNFGIAIGAGYAQAVNLGYKTGLSFGTLGGFPGITTGGTFIGATGHISTLNTITVGYGIDWQLPTFTNALFRARQFIVDGAGVIRQGTGAISYNGTGLSIDVNYLHGVAEAATISGGAIVSGGTGGFIVGDLLFDAYNGIYSVQTVPAGAITALKVVHQSFAPVGTSATVSLTIAPGSLGTGTVTITQTWTTDNTMTLQPSGGGLKIGAVAAVTCSGTPTASFASTNGIVTHC